MLQLRTLLPLPAEIVIHAWMGDQKRSFEAPPEPVLGPRGARTRAAVFHDKSRLYAAHEGMALITARRATKSSG